MTELRRECVRFIEGWADLISNNKYQDILDVGIAGDVKPGGNYYLFSDKNYKTSDIDAKYEPDFVFDICYPPEELHNSFDVVILSNTIEHIFEKEKAIDGCYKLLREGGTLIIDCPWVCGYHAEDGFGDYWRISATAMEELLKRQQFTKIITEQGVHCTSGMAVK